MTARLADVRAATPHRPTADQRQPHDRRTRAVFGAGSVVSGDPSGSLLLDEPFRRVDTYREPVWRSHARLLGARGRRIAAVEIEISPWSTVDTQLLLRPRAKNPYRWSGRRMRRYFTHAHRRVDDLTQLLTVNDSRPRPNASIQEHCSRPVRITRPGGSSRARRSSAPAGPL